MKHSIFFSLATGMIMSIPYCADAQKGYIDVGVRGGLSIPELHGGTNEISKGYTSRLAPNFGITASYGIIGNLSLVMEVDYASQGGKRVGMQPVPAANINGLPISNTLYADFTNNAILNYLEVPVMAKLKFGKKLKYYANVGPYVGFLLNAKTKTSGTSNLYLDKNKNQPLSLSPETPLPAQSFDATTDVKNDINPINFGITGGLGLGYQSGRHGLWLDGRFALGLTNIQKDTQKNGSNNTGNLMIDIGYTFTLAR